MHTDTLKFWKYNPVKKPMYSGKFCHYPFDTLQIDQDGDVQLCDCQLFMPYTIGNIYKNTLQEIWLNEHAAQVRQSIIDEDFTYCSWSCAHLSHLPNRPAEIPDLNNFPRIIKLDMDRSCNLKCPSCREAVIIEKNSHKIDQQIKIYEQIKQWAVDNPEMTLTILPMSSGEIFASHSGLQFLKSLQDYPYNNLKIRITTNGTLLYRNRDLIKNISHLIDLFAVSLDAATAETYANVRGGDWEELMQGLEFIKSQFNNTKLIFRFCIQKNNWQEIEQFARLADYYGAMINYQKLLDWGHWTIDWWHENNVLDRTRDTFDAVIDSIQKVKLKYPGRISTAAEISNYLEKDQQA